MEVLQKVLDFNPTVARATDSYIDDIIVNNKRPIVDNHTVLSILQKFNLVAKQPELLDGSRIFGLRIQKNEQRLEWTRDNKIIEIEEPITWRKVFSWCGQMVG